MTNFVEATLQQKGLPSKFYRQATIGLLFIKMSEDTSTSVTDVRGWGNRLQGMKCPSNLVTFKPFEKWGMNFVGPINLLSKQRSYIIVCTDYLTKWAETKSIKAVTEEKVAEFLRENIFYKFGYPRELVTDQESKFTSNLIEDLLAHHKIKHKTSTPYHPQANGQVEVTNRALEGILTKVVSSDRKDWADRLVEAT